MVALLVERLGRKAQLARQRGAELIANPLELLDEGLRLREKLIAGLALDACDRDLDAILDPGEPLLELYDLVPVLGAQRAYRSIQLTRVVGSAGADCLALLADVCLENLGAIPNGVLDLAATVRDQVVEALEPPLEPDDNVADQDIPDALDAGDRVGCSILVLCVGHASR
jgi:hypothetical protein